MADDLVTASDAGPRQFRVLLEAAGNGEHADRNRKVAKDIEQTPSAATAAVLEYGFDKRHAATRLRANSNVVEHTLGNIIAVRERALAAALDVEIEIDRDQSAARPRWIRGRLAVSNEIAGDHGIRLWFKHCPAPPHILLCLRNTRRTPAAGDSRLSRVLGVRDPRRATSSRWFLGFGLLRASERRQTGIVAVEPVHIRRSPHPTVLDRDALHLAHPGDARCLVPAKSLGRVIDARQAARQDRGIFDRHGAACRHKGAHGMAGVSQQHDPAAAPAIVALAVEDRPYAHVIGRLQYAEKIAVEVRKTIDELLARSGHGGSIAFPFRCRNDSDDIDLVAFARHEIRENMPVATPPFGAIGYFEPAQPLRRKDRPMGDGVDEARRLRVNDEFARFRIDAIGADDNVGIELHAVLENEADRTAQFLERHQPMIEGHRVRRDGSMHDRMQIAAVNVEIGSAETRLAGCIEYHLIESLTGVPGATDIATRLEAGLDEIPFDAEPAQRLRHVGAEDDSRTDAGEGGGLLIDGRRKAGAPQEAGNSQTTEPCTDNRDTLCPRFDGRLRLRSRHFGSSDALEHLALARFRCSTRPKPRQLQPKHGRKRRRIRHTCINLAQAAGLTLSCCFSSVKSFEVKRNASSAVRRKLADSRRAVFPFEPNNIQPRSSVMRPLARLQLLVAVAAAFFGVLPAHSADVNFITDFGFNGRHAYYYVALDKGYYKAEGLNVNILRGQGSIDAVKKVASGAADMGFADDGALVLARGNDAIPVKLLAIVYASPPHAIFTTADRGIKVAKDLEGKTVADSAFSAIPVIFKAYAQAAGVDAGKVKWISAESV